MFYFSFYFNMNLCTDGFLVFYFSFSSLMKFMTENEPLNHFDTDVLPNRDFGSSWVPLMFNILYTLIILYMWFFGWFYSFYFPRQGIEIKSPFLWPYNRGLSFSCWLRVENFPDNGMMGLFSFFTEDGKGCSAVLNRSALVYEVIVIFFPSFNTNQVLQKV